MNASPQSSIRIVFLCSLVQQLEGGACSQPKQSHPLWKACNWQKHSISKTYVTLQHCLAGRHLPRLHYCHITNFTCAKVTEGMHRKISGFRCRFCLHLDVSSTVGTVTHGIALVASIMACVERIWLAIALARVLLLGLQCSATSHCLTCAAVCFRLKLGGDSVYGEFHRLDIE
jgi:hypothetical protein